jgi:hypothetical protein
MWKFLLFQTTQEQKLNSGNSNQKIKQLNPICKEVTPNKIVTMTQSYPSAN